MLVLSLISWITAMVAFAAPNDVTIFEDEQGFKLQVDGVDTMLFGMNWGYMPIGENYRYDFWSLPEDKIEEGLRSEMALLRGMGVNTIRQYPTIPPKWVEWIHDNYGIYTMVNPLVGRYGVDVDGTFVPQTPYGDPEVRKMLIEETVAVAERYKDTRGVVMFLLGNEANYGLEWTSFEIANLPKGDRQRAKAKHLYSLYGEIIDRIHAIDDNHPVAICNGDLQYLDLIAELAPNMDIMASNVYRGRSSRDLFDRVKEELGIPFFYAEFGADAFDAKNGREDGVTQASYLRDQWREIYEHTYGKGRSGVAIGGYIFQWSDGWWKYQQEINLDVHDNTASWSNKAYIEDWTPDGNNMNEEWFGIAGKTPPGPDGLYAVQPREAYFLLKEAFRLDPYAPDTTIDTIQSHFGMLEPTSFKVQADVGRIAADSAKRIARISDLRFEFGTLSSGGTGKSGRRPLGLTSDHLQSLYLGVEATPASNLRFETAINVLGNVPGNYIDPIRFETRGRGQVSEEITDVDLSPLDRLQIYRASFEWRTKDFDLEGFYRTGHYHWAHEGDFFGLYPEANYGPNLDLYNGQAPIGVAFSGKRKLNGLKVVFGPQVFWGANPAIFAKYSRPMGRFRFDIVHQEDVAPLPTAAVAQSQAVPEQLTRKTGLHLGYARGQNFTVDLGGIWAGTPKIGQTYTYVDEAADGELSYLDTGYHVLTDEIRMIDTFGAKARITGRVGKLYGWAQGAYKGLVADGGWENWLPGTRLGESGRGNQMSAWGGARLALGKLTLGTSGLWQRPLIGPNPSVGAQFDSETNVFYPGIRARNFIQDPFAVLDNRETLAGEVMLVWDPTPVTYFFQWDNAFREDAPLAGSLHFTYKHQPTSRDAGFGFLADGTLFSFGGAPPAQDIWEVSTRIVSNVGGWQLHLNGYVGNGQSRGTDERVIFRKGGGIKAFYKSLVIDSWVKVDDWGPYDFHQDFNLTFPLQTYLDISGGLKRPPLVGVSPRFGGFVKVRLLDEFSPVPAAVGAPSVAFIEPGDPWANEFAVGTYVRLSL